MKKFNTCVLTLCLCLLLAGMVLAAVSTDRPITVVKKTSVVTDNQTKIHRVVVGSALYNTPNLSYWYKYTEGPYVYWNVRLDLPQYANTFSAEEIAFLDNLYLSHGNNVNVFVDLTDLTTQVVEIHSFTSGDWHGAKKQLPKVFPDYTDVVTTYQTFFEQLDPYTVLEHTIEFITTLDHKYQLIAWGCESPIILDLDYNDKVDVANNRWMPHLPKIYNQYVRKFDMTGSGDADFTEWIAPNPSDGLLCIPENGKVETALQLFGTAGGFNDGYEKLSIVCDRDKNGYVEGKELEGLALWIDSNNNAICEKEELKSLADHGVARIATNHKDFKSVYYTTDGTKHSTWDWWPSLMEVRKIRR